MSNKDSLKLFKIVSMAAKHRESEIDGRRGQLQDPVSASCGLCLYYRHPKAFSKQRNVCMSCSMRDMRPRWLNTENGLIARMRKLMGMEAQAFAELCGWKKARQSRLEMQAKINFATAQQIAIAFTRLTVKGADTSAAVKLWPLFCLLVPPEMVEAWVDDGQLLESSQVDSDVGEEERYGDLP